MFYFVYENKGKMGGCHFSNGMCGCHLEGSYVNNENWKFSKSFMHRTFHQLFCIEYLKLKIWRMRVWFEDGSCRLYKASVFIDAS